MLLPGVTTDYTVFFLDGMRARIAGLPGARFELAGETVGRIWEEARRRPVADAIAVATPEASRAITTAGVALAASFAMLAVIPLEQFRQIAIAMALGVVLDAIAVRSLLVPALVALFGRLGMWPGNRSVPPVAPGEAASRQPASAGDQPSAVG